jgi:uncharacterized cupin superfamily protein
MMKIRRVTTGQREDGKSVIADDSMVEGIKTALIPSMEFHRLWEQDEIPRLPTKGTIPALGTYFPGPGGFRFGLFTVPPETEMVLDDADQQKAFTELGAQLSGLFDPMEPEHPGMHTTDTVDFEYIVSGDVWLELDDGQEVHLKAGDTVVQNGTRHAWRNRSSDPCRIVFCFIGARRK